MSDVYAGLTAALADRYRIEHEVGEGGMATVYLAEDLRHHRKVLRQAVGRAYGDGVPLLPITRAVIRMDPLFAQIRNDPRVQKLLADDAAWVVK